MNGDAYAKGWAAGRGEGIHEVRAALIRALPGRTVLLGTGPYVHVDDVLAIIDDTLRERLHHPTQSELRVMDGNR